MRISSIVLYDSPGIGAPDTGNGTPPARSETTEPAGKRADQSASAEKVRAQGTHEADDGPDQAANSRTADCRRAEDGADAAPDAGSHGSRYGRFPSCTNDRITEI